VIVGDDVERAVVPPSERRTARDRVERERVVHDARRLPRLLQVGQRELRALRAREVVVGARGSAGQVEQVHARVQPVGRRRVRRDVTAHQRP
jgi:hypothetical protein